MIINTLQYIVYTVCVHYMVQGFINTCIVPTEEYGIYIFQIYIITPVIELQSCENTSLENTVSSLVNVKGHIKYNKIIKYLKQ